MIGKKLQYLYIMISLTVVSVLNTGWRFPSIEPCILEEKKLETALKLPSPPYHHETTDLWLTEMTIGNKFAFDGDLYRAITAFKRAAYLIPHGHIDSIHGIEYRTLLAYYIGSKYDSVISSFIQSSLHGLTNASPLYQDVIILLYSSYIELGMYNSAEVMFNLLDTQIAKGLVAYEPFIHGDVDKLSQLDINEQIRQTINSYKKGCKSPTKAQLWNAIMPGAGYLYLKQTQSAVTTFLLNGLFIWASVHCYSHNHIAAGIVLSGLELGWYFGSIYGAGESAKLYNERLYEKLAYPLIGKHIKTPMLMLRYGF